MDNPNRAQQITTWLASLPSSRTVAHVASNDAKREAILLLLGKLALHYWRPDFTPGQARQLYTDYADDLEQYPLEAIQEAIRQHRQSGERFYPQSGQLVQLIATPYSWESKRERSERLRVEARKEIEAMPLALSGPSPALLEHK